MKDIVQFSYLGRFGRLGNQLFQYAFARSYAESINAELEVPDWIGRHIFKGLAGDKYISKTLPLTNVDSVPWGNANIDLLGYFQFKEALGIINKANVLKWFDFHDHLVSSVPKYELCAHLRRGDYLIHDKVFCVVSEQSYLLACDEYGLSHNSVKWVSEDICNIDNVNGIDRVLFDFIALMKSNILLRSNSTFAWWAGELGQCDVYSPIIDNMVGHQDVHFIKGNYPKIIGADISKDTPMPSCDLVLGSI
jgi:hypothetical protein